MKNSPSPFDRFDKLDTSINKWLVANSINILRFTMGIVFLGFGVLKFFTGISPIESLATRTTSELTLGIFTGHSAMVFVAILECLIGFCFLTGMFLRVGVWLLALQMVGAMSPLFLYPSELFSGTLHAPTLEAQYIIKDIILIAAGMVIASTWTGARIVAKPQAFRVSLSKRVAVVYQEISALS
jgi:putative oxidoreductase